MAGLWLCLLSLLLVFLRLSLSICAFWPLQTIWCDWTLNSTFCCHFCSIFSLRYGSRSWWMYSIASQYFSALALGLNKAFELDDSLWPFTVICHPLTPWIHYGPGLELHKPSASIPQALFSITPPPTQKFFNTQCHYQFSCHPIN